MVGTRGAAPVWGLANGRCPSRVNLSAMDLIDEAYWDDGGLREQDRVSAEVFVSDRDRAQITGRGVPFFSGREAEIRIFRRVANALLLGRQGNATVVVEGPPGAGKSALMGQFMEEMRSFPQVGPARRRWLPVPLSAKSAESPAAIADAIDKAIVTRLAADLLAAEATAPETGPAATLAERLGDYWGDVNPAGARAKAKEFFDRGGSVFGFSLGASREGPPTTIEDAAGRRSNAWKFWQVVLMVDEAQGIRPGKPHAGEGTLSALHQGLVDAPVSFCAFGLPGTVLALGDVDVSRPTGGRTVQLAGLEASAAQQTVNRCFSAFGVTNGAPWREAILARSANWPQHLAIYLVEAIEQIRGASPKCMDAGCADLAAAMRLGDLERTEYYGRRVARLGRRRGEFEEIAREIVPFLRDHDRTAPYSDVLNHVNEIMRTNPLLSATSATEFIRDSEHAGFLAVSSGTGGRVCSMPIPSFAGYLLGEPLPGLDPPELPGEDGTKHRTGASGLPPLS